MQHIDNNGDDQAIDLGAVVEETKGGTSGLIPDTQNGVKPMFEGLSDD